MTNDTEMKAIWKALAELKEHMLNQIDENKVIFKHAEGLSKRVNELEEVSANLMDVVIKIADCNKIPTSYFIKKEEE